MNKLFLLRALIGFLAVCIFVALTFVIYGVFFYEKKKYPLADMIVEVTKPDEQMGTNVYLPEGNPAIQSMSPCGPYLCLLMEQGLRQYVLQFDPTQNRIVSRTYFFDKKK